ncbi:hypothetical protein E2C01_008058 [Portunus trituberculatus]|uniref:Uncharacterized protein n=1 Tax=Portunus trituberculatus TaxID=210409 RepID=A0A5B7CZS8_PORTR|nr:hypothetical protein [Portunus trituberculatus]
MRLSNCLNRLASHVPQVIHEWTHKARNTARCPREQLVLCGSEVWCLSQHTHQHHTLSVTSQYSRISKYGNNQQQSAI